MRKIYTFKEIAGKDELEEYFRLRYEIYSSCENKIFLHDNNNQIDIDTYDTHSCHYSLTSGENRVGYARAVFPQKKLTNKDVLNIAEKYGILDGSEYYQRNAKAPFPFLSYPGVPESHWSFYKKLQSKDEQLVEVSRLIIRENLRSLRIAKYLIECLLGLFIYSYSEEKHGVINCDIAHQLFYNYYGFNLIGDTGGYTIQGLTKVSLYLIKSPESVPVKLHEKFSEMAKEYEMTGKIEREL